MQKGWERVEAVPVFRHDFEKLDLGFGWNKIQVSPICILYQWICTKKDCLFASFFQLYSETLDFQFHWKKIQGFKNSYTPYYQWAFTNMECLFAIVTFLRLNSQKPGHWEPCWEMLRVVESCWELLRVVESLTCYHWTFARFWLFVCQHLKLSK